MRCDEHVMCCDPQLELGRFDCLQAPHGNWEVEGGECTDAVAMTPGCLWHFGDFENGEGHNAKEGMWVKPAGEKCQSKQLGFD